MTRVIALFWMLLAVSPMVTTVYALSQGPETVQIVSHNNAQVAEEIAADEVEGAQQ